MNQCHIGLDALNDIVFGLLPKFVAGPCAQFCTKVFVPHLARLASEVVILKPVACSSKYRFWNWNVFPRVRLRAAPGRDLE